MVGTGAVLIEGATKEKIEVSIDTTYGRVMAATPTTGSVDGATTRRIIQTLKRYLGEANRPLTVERTRERVQEEALGFTVEEVNAVINTSAVVTNASSDTRQISAATVPISQNVSGATDKNDEVADEVDGLAGEYGGINIEFEAGGNSSPSPSEMPVTTADVAPDDLTKLKSVGNARAESLHDAGFATYDAVQSASTDELVRTNGVDVATAETIQQSAEYHTDPIAQIAVDVFSEKDTGSSATEEKVRIANEVDIPAGEVFADSEAELRQNENGELRLGAHPVLEHTGNPFINDAAQFEPFKQRVLDNGETAVEAVAKLVAQGNAVGLSGYPAVGKDTIIEYAFAKVNAPVLRLPANASMIAQNLFGVRKMENGEVVWVDGPVPKCVKYGWKLVIDEIDSLDPGVALALNRLLENGGKLYLEDRNKVIEPHPQFSLLATKNPNEPGFGGTTEPNEAFLSRFSWLDIPYLSVQKEAELVDAKANGKQRVFSRSQSHELVEMANEFREGAAANKGLPRLSTRHLLNAADLAQGAPNKLGAVKEIVEGACGPRDKDEAALEQVDNLETFD